VAVSKGSLQKNGREVWDVQSTCMCNTVSKLINTRTVNKRYLEITKISEQDKFRLRKLSQRLKTFLITVKHGKYTYIIKSKEYSAFLNN